MIALVIAAAVGALAYVVASSSIEKADVRESLRRVLQRVLDGTSQA